MRNMTPSHYGQSCINQDGLDQFYSTDKARLLALKSKNNRKEYLMQDPDGTFFLYCDPGRVREKKSIKLLKNYLDAARWTLRLTENTIGPIALLPILRPAMSGHKWELSDLQYDEILSGFGTGLLNRTWDTDGTVLSYSMADGYLEKSGSASRIASNRIFSLISLSYPSLVYDTKRKIYILHYGHTNESYVISASQAEEFVLKGFFAEIHWRDIPGAWKKKYGSKSSLYNIFILPFCECNQPKEKQVKDS